MAQVYKKEILAEVNKSINEKIRGKLIIKDISFTIFSHFPSLSLTLVEPSVRDSLYDVHHQELFHADNVFLQLELLKLITGRVDLHDVTIQNGSIHLLKMKNGYKNFDIVKKDTSQQVESKQSSLTATVNNVILKNVAFSYIDSSKNKWFKFHFNDVVQSLSFKDSVTSSNVRGVVHFEGLAFNPDKGSYLTGKTASVNLFLDYYANQKHLEIRKSKLIMDKFIFFLSGNFTFRDTSLMHLEIDAPKVTVNEAGTILPNAITTKLSKFAFTQPLQALVVVQGRLYYGGKPAADVYFKTANNTLVMETKSFTEVSLAGWFLNHIDSTRINDDHNSRVVISKFSGNLGGIPLKSRMVMTDLLDPRLFMDATVDMSLQDANGLVDSSLIYFGDGSVSVSFKYNGKLIDYLDTTNHTLKGNVRGRITVKNGQMDYWPRNLQFERINTDMTFDDSLLNIRHLLVDLNKNPLSISGSIAHFIQFIFIPGDILTADLEINVSSLNFDNFNIKKTEEKPVKKSAAEEKAAKKKISNVITNIIDVTEANIVLHAGEVKARKFKATDVNGEVTVSDDFVKFNDLNMQTSGGTFSLTGGISDLGKAPFRMNIGAKINNADISQLFYSFDNFGQKTVTNENVRGKLSTTVNFSAMLKKDYAIMPETMNGKIVLQLKQGALLNFKSFQDISKYVFKNRDFDHIEFALLKDTLSVKGHDITISRMEIESNVLSLFVEGIYSFNVKTDMSIQIPLSNLKKRDENYKPANVGTDVKLGPSIFLRAVNDSDGNVQIKFDPFKMYFKDKMAAETVSDDKETKAEKKSKKKKESENN